jgi:hypothetical protein
MMNPDPTYLVSRADIKHPLIGFYDLPDPSPFEPFSKPGRCVFEAYQAWLGGKYTCLSNDEYTCRGGGYWIGGKEYTTREKLGTRLNQKEGFKESDQQMCQWLENQKPYLIKNGYVVIGPVKEDHTDYLKTVTFYVDSDQLSLLLMGAHYRDASASGETVTVPFGSGCGLMAAVLGSLETDAPRAVIGATDIAMRQHLPPEILAFTVNRPMYKQLCELNEDSFLGKSFLNRLKHHREEQNKIEP